MTRLVAIFAYWLGIDALFYWLNRKSKRIITFHNVLPDEMFREGVANGVSNRLSDFLQIVEQCRKRFKINTDLFDNSSLTITFDDGYRNQYTVAFKALCKLSIPAIVFVSGDVARGGLLIDKLLHWVAEAPIELIPNKDRLRYWCDEIWPAFMKDVDGKGENVFKRLDSKYTYEKIASSLPVEYLDERMGVITSEELDKMRSAG